VNGVWGAQCGKSARWVLLGETSARSHAHSARGAGMCFKARLYHPNEFLAWPDTEPLVYSFMGARKWQLVSKWHG
jgi:hypothetical protein